jgi:hypothetical protein
VGGLLLFHGWADWVAAYMRDFVLKVRVGVLKAAEVGGRDGKAVRGFVFSSPGVVWGREIDGYVFQRIAQREGRDARECDGGETVWEAVGGGLPGSV